MNFNLKKHGKSMLISLALFIVLLISGVVCIVYGASKVTTSGELEKIGDIIEEYVDLENVHFSVNTSDTEHITQEKSVEIGEDISRVVFANGIYDIRFAYSTDNLMHVDFDGYLPIGLVVDTTSESDAESSVVDLRIEGDTVYVELEANSFGVISIGNIGGTVTVLLPAEYSGELELADCAGDIEISGLTLSALSVNNMAGEMNVERCDIDIFNADSVTGEINIEGMLRGVSLSNVAGEINIDSDCAFEHECTIENIAGEVNIELPAGSAVLLSSDSVFGKVKVEGNNDPKAAHSVEVNVDSVFGEVIIEIDDR